MTGPERAQRSDDQPERSRRGQEQTGRAQEHPERPRQRRSATDRTRSDRARPDRARPERSRPGSAGGHVTGVLPIADPVRDGRGSAQPPRTEPAADASLPHRVTDWIIEHWGAKPGRHPYLPVGLVALAAVLALVAWMLGPAQNSPASVDAAPVTPTPSAAPSPAAVPPPAPVSAEPAPGSGAVAPPSGQVTRVARAATAGSFPSGVAAHTVAEATAWAQFRGRPVDVVVTYTDRNSWDAIVNPWIGRSASTFSNFAGTLVVSVPLFPVEGSELGNLTDCAAGDYNAKWRQFGRWLVNEGRGDSFVRLGWEFNGDWFAWRASANPTAYVQCFRNASSSIKATSPKVRIDWNINAHGPRSAFAVYPGDQYVDVIGIDSYDQYPPSPTLSAFDAQCDATEGLCQVISFARRHNKLFSVPEWGVVSQQNTKAGAVGQAGGDNPVYIERMYSIFERNADILAYEAYFSDDVPGNVHSSLLNPNRHPRSADTYKRLW
ncbi:conserved hypothetical protein [Parafrankia sp. Ea1.12]|nr:conserved hypothetical protein [Parafrankia sp. Ea1.12]